MIYLDSCPDFGGFSFGSVTQDDYFSFGFPPEFDDQFSYFENVEPVKTADYSQHSDFKVFSIRGAFLGKTCEIFGDFSKPAFIDEIGGAVGTPVSSLAFSLAFQKHKEAGGSVSDFLEYDEKKRKRKQKRVKTKVQTASDFTVLRDMQKLQDGKKHIKIENLKLLDFNGTDFGNVSEIHQNLKLSDFQYTDFKEVRAIDSETGELFTFTVQGKGYNKKYILQSSMSSLDDRFSMQKKMAKLLPEFRVSKCLSCVQNKSKPLSVFKSVKHGVISVSNLQTCGSVWHCPVCAAKVTEKRRVELNQAIEAHKAASGSISLVTRTVPHSKNDSLQSMRDRFSSANNYMKEHYQYKKMRARFAVKGDVRTYEITTTWQNGWHLHIHEVIFHNPEAFEGLALESNPAYVAFLKDFEQTFYDIWHDSATKAGFESPSRKHGLQVQNGDFAAEYVAKWGHEPSSSWDASAEMTKGHIKSSKKGFTPWQLIRMYRDTGDERLEPIIREYAHTMHGARQLAWSKGLKKAFGIGEKTDEELAEQIDDTAEELGVLSPLQWKFIIKNDLRSEVYHFAGEGWDVLTDFLYSFDKYPKIFSLDSTVKKS